jgi:hypothetical protein
MARPTETAIAAIRAQVTDWSPGNAAISDALNVADQPNPTARPEMLKLLSGRTVLGSLSQGSQAAVMKLPVAPKILESINAQDRVSIEDWAYALAGSGSITVSEAGGIVALLSETEPDPAWPELVSWASIHLGRPADPEDVAASRPGD